jgi:hypothetical protein
MLRQSNVHCRKRVRSGDAGTRAKAEVSGLDLFKKAKGRLSKRQPPLKCYKSLSSFQALGPIRLFTLEYLLAFRVEIASFVAGVLAATLDTDEALSNAKCECSHGNHTSKHFEREPILHCRADG